MNDPPPSYVDDRLTQNSQDPYETDLQTLVSSVADGLSEAGKSLTLAEQIPADAVSISGSETFGRTAFLLSRQGRRLSTAAGRLNDILIDQRYLEESTRESYLESIGLNLRGICSTISDVKTFLDSLNDDFPQSQPRTT